MPYEARLKEGSERKKPDYRVTNCSGYNLSLKKAQTDQPVFPAGGLRSQFINPSPWASGISGRAPKYDTSYIELIYTFYRLFGWACGKSDDIGNTTGHSSTELRSFERSVF